MAAAGMRIHMVGNSHIDPVWLWRWQEGFAEIKATFRSALDRLEEFPEFVFTCAGAAYYKWVEENCPEMFAEIRARVAEGRWVIVGGQWLQPDCNIPSGEAFARHGLYSQRYYRAKFGRAAQVCYNVDSFGHTASLPQIIKNCGMDSYVFQRPDEREKALPGWLFRWVAPDGSAVTAYRLPLGYATFDDWYTGLRTENKLRSVMKAGVAAGTDMMYFYGVGNHGGGPTIRTLTELRGLRATITEAELVMSSPDAYFDEISRRGEALPTVTGDLLTHAPGCYAITSEIKAANRKAEHRLVAAERFAAAAHRLAGFEYPHDSLARAWDGVMFNHFHDIMGGCSVKSAFDDARELHGESLSLGAKALNAAIQKLSWAIDTSRGGDLPPRSKEKDWLTWEFGDEGAPLVVFNPHSWAVRAQVRVNRIVKSVTDSDGRALTTQSVRGEMLDLRFKHDTLFMVDLPAFGYKVFWLYQKKEIESETFPQKVIAAAGDEAGAVLENDFVRVEIDGKTGWINSIYSKTAGAEITGGSAAVPIIIEDAGSDTWAHGKTEFSEEIGRFGNAEISVLEVGPLRAVVRVKSRWGASELRQDYCLYEDRPDLEVRVRLNWNEKHKYLKLAFPVRAAEPKATYEIPFGFVERPADGLEYPGQQWLDLSGEDNGLTLLNDAKYSFSVKDGEMRMAIARSPAFADHFGERDEECEFIDQGVQEFRYALIPHGAEAGPADHVRKALEFNVPPVLAHETYHKGPLPLVFSGIAINAPNIVASAFKRVEDGDGYILRCYETAGRDTEARISLIIAGREWKACFGGHEIKTWFIPDEDGGQVEETDFTEIRGQGRK